MSAVPWEPGADRLSSQGLHPEELLPCVSSIKPKPHPFRKSAGTGSASSPVEHPGAAFVSLGDVVLWQEPRTAGGQGGAIDPTLAGAGLLHGRHENEVPWDQLQLVVILGGVGVDNLQGLEKREQ